MGVSGRRVYFNRNILKFKRQRREGMSRCHLSATSVPSVSCDESFQPINHHRDTEDTEGHKELEC